MNGYGGPPPAQNKQGGLGDLQQNAMMYSSWMNKSGQPPPPPPGQ